MAESPTPVCDNHEAVVMTRVWTDDHGKAVCQCPACGGKKEVRDDRRRR